MNHCPVLAGFLSGMKASLPHEIRRELSPYLNRLNDTRSTRKVEEQRSYRLTVAATQEILPLILDSAGATDRANYLRSMPPVTDVNSVVRSIDAAVLATIKVFLVDQRGRANEIEVVTAVTHAALMARNAVGKPKTTIAAPRNRVAESPIWNDVLPLCLAALDECLGMGRV